MTITAIASASQVLWRILELRGVDPADVFRDAGLNPEKWNDPDARFSDGALDAAWRRAVEITGDPCLGLEAARCINPASLHALGFAWLVSDNLVDALSRLVRYSDLISNGLDLQLSLSDNECTLVIDQVSFFPLGLEVRFDALCAGVVALCRLTVSESLSPTSVSLRREAPPCSADYYALYRAPVSFCAKVNSITFERAAAERPLPTSNRVLALQSEKTIDDYLARFKANTFSDRVRMRLIELLPSGAFAEADVAKMLNVSQRTLQRRLADDGTSFKVLLDEARRELALRFIGEHRLSIKETSYLLGFSEPGNFSRAFKRWTGTTPSDFRVADNG
jgi:AraC-like DNA-binding protein